jgi:membrane protein DedA with SNARE-associated domain
MEQYLTLLQDGLAAAGLWFIVGFLFLENVPGAGLIAPGLTVLVLGGFFHELVVAHPAQLYIIAWVTIVVADNLWYWLGYFGKGRIGWLQKIADQSPNINELLTKQSLWALWTYQFMPYFRMFLPFSFGMYKLSPNLWLPINLIASALYVGVFLSIGVIGAQVVEGVGGIDQITTNLNHILAVAATIYGIVLIRRFHKLRGE